MTIRFEKDNDKLLLVYEPEYNIEAVRKSLDEDNLNLKHTFHLGRKTNIILHQRKNLKRSSTLLLEHWLMDTIDLIERYLEQNTTFTFLQQ